MSLQGAFDSYLPQVEKELQQIVQAPDPNQTTYYAMMRYHLGWTDEALQAARNATGKRLRPLVCLLCCQAAGGNPRQALPSACAIELVHNFSLVHDDIEDASPMRRGRRAVWSVWGTAHGINVGDGLFVLARVALHRLQGRGVRLRRYQAATQALDQACLSLCEGQFLDMTFEDRSQVDLDEYLGMIHLKTGALLAASAQLGAILATDDQRLIDLYRSFGQNLGMAFQIQDDVLGIWGEEGITGKPAGTDLRDKKKTLPVVYALSLAGDRAAAGRLAGLYAQPGPLDVQAIESALEALDHVGARQYAEQRANEYYHLAIGSLDQTRIVNAAQSDLRELAASLLGRKT